MKNKLNEQFKIELDKLIAQFNYSYMSNSKWKKLFAEILKNRKLIRHCEIYDYINPCVNEIAWYKISKKSYLEVDKEYISEKLITGEYSTPYKYIEYIEFLKEWKVYSKYALIEPKIEKQDTDEIKKVLSKIGMFEWEEDEKSLRIIAYRK